VLKTPQKPRKMNSLLNYETPPENDKIIEVILDDSSRTSSSSLPPIQTLEKKIRKASKIKKPEGKPLYNNYAKPKLPMKHLEPRRQLKDDFRRVRTFELPKIYERGINGDVLEPVIKELDSHQESNISKKSYS